MIRLRRRARWWMRSEAARFPVVLVFILIGAATVSGLVTLEVGEARAAAPTDALRDFFGAVNVVLNDPETVEQPQERLRAIRRRLDDVFDFREAAMLALGREWTVHTPVEQDEFVALFADLLERSFVWRVAGKASLNGGLRIAYLNEVVNGDAATVETKVATRDGNPLRLDYRMVYRAERWVVRDVVMDGVSTMDNYRAQFQRLARDGSWPDLIAQLREKLAAPGAPAQVVAAPPPMMWPSELRASNRVAEPLERVPAPPRRVAQGSSPVADVRPAAAAPIADVRPAVATLVADVRPAPLAPVPAPILAAPPPAEPPVAPAATAPTPTVTTRENPTIEPAPAVNQRQDPPREVATVPTSRATSARIAHPSLWVQVGAYRNAAAAGRVAAEVHGEILVVATPASPEPPLLRVRVGPFPDRAQALQRLHELQSQGWRAFIAESRD